MAEVNAIFHVTRLSPNEAVREVVRVWARNPEEARRVAAEDDWLPLLCGPADWFSPADYGPPRIIREEG
jgi:hypothetical protein